MMFRTLLLVVALFGVPVLISHFMLMSDMPIEVSTLSAAFIGTGFGGIVAVVWREYGSPD